MRTGTLWWLSTVLDKQFPSANHKLLMLDLANYVDENDSCFPGQQRLAGATQVSVRTVRKLIADLVDLGCIDRQRRHTEVGHRTSDRYTLVRAGVLALPDCEDCHSSEAESLAADVASRPTDQRQNGHGLAANQPSLSAAIVPSGAQEQPSNEQPSLEEQQRAFEAAWNRYPRKTNKGGARAAWDKAVARSSVFDVMAGVERFAADPNLPDTQYVAHMSTWLNGSRWEDGPLPSRRDAALNNRTPYNTPDTDRGGHTGRVDKSML